jgi:hypothetical protein
VDPNPIRDSRSKKLFKDCSQERVLKGRDFSPAVKVGKKRGFSP